MALTVSGETEKALTGGFVAVRAFRNVEGASNSTKVMELQDMQAYKNKLL